MKPLEFQITEQDIKNYLKKYKKYYKGAEALFVKYIFDHQFELTEEMIEMMAKKDLPSDFDSGLSCFYPDCPEVQNLDLSGICHILIPTIRYYDWDRPSIQRDRLYADLDMVARELSIPISGHVEASHAVGGALADYIISEKLEIKITGDNLEFIDFKMSREDSLGELVVYDRFYGEEKVKKIGELIKKTVSKTVQEF